MSVIHAPETTYAKELWKWDHFVTEVNPADPSIRGMRPIGFQEYPKMLFRSNALAPDGLGIDATITVGNPDEERMAQSQGFCLTQEAALEAARGLQLDVAKAAAERAYADRLMTAKAQREAAAADAETDAHLGEIPRTPVRRGRPKKVTVPS